ncbi:hypothetical protein [[Ruminococcus] lactaris]|uniref:Uncharacterized protein n=1 Tax=[Ruminococcus] lactaris ATCC 29176 TaxID=471875 RepID=B5CPZ4_9FIRM|nr:hypothetical protein RUMLAC_01539 [[Ruminococcus] lactaris ATCC 29176]
MKNFNIQEFFFLLSDACGLLRATHFHNPTQYSHIVGLSSHFYAHIGAGPKVFHPPMSKLMWA